jgi:hypothetical protein
LDEGGKNSSSPLVSGILTFNNSDTDKPLRIFTSTDDDTKLNIIARIACSELGFKGVSSISSASVDAIKTKYTNADYLSYIKSNFYGLECNGTEKSIKNCQVSFNPTYEQTFYELYLECYGTIIKLSRIFLILIFHTFFSQWILVSMGSMGYMFSIMWCWCKITNKSL